MIPYRKLIKDQNEINTLVASLLSKGYCPTPVGAGDEAKGWLYGDEDLQSIRPSQEHGIRDSFEKDVEDYFKVYRNCGVGVYLPCTRNPDVNIAGIDVDFDDEPTLEAIAHIIGQPCPVKRGNRGVTFFVRAAPNLLTPKVSLKARDIDPKGMATNTKIKCPFAKGHIDVLGMAKGMHTILPPSQHVLATKFQGREVNYKWVPFPGTLDTIPLESVNAADLPMIQDWHIFLIYLYCKNPGAACWDFIGGTSPGDFHESMLLATTYMHHEGATRDELREICLREAEATSDSPDKLRERTKQIDNALRGLADVTPSPSGGRRSASTPGDGKVPADRQMCDWMLQKIGIENLALFHGQPYRWTDEHGWKSFLEEGHLEPWTKIYTWLHSKFPTDGHRAMKSAVALFMSVIPSRDTEQNENLIAFSNGIYDVSRQQFRDEVREDFIPNRLPWPYEPEAKCEKWREFMYHMFPCPITEHDDRPRDEVSMRTDAQRAIDTFEEYIGMCLVRTHAFQVMLLIYGPTGTGKSELVKTVQGLFARGQVSTVGLDELDNPNSCRAMVNSLINISGETGRHTKNVDEALLKITAGEAVPVKTLYADVRHSILSSRLLLHGNLPPSSGDATGAIARRFIPLRTTPRRPKVKVRDFHRQLLEEAPGILAALVTAYSRLLARGHFDLPYYAEHDANEISSGSNSVTLWMKECTAEPQPESNDSTANGVLYASYSEWCMQNGLKAFSSVQWGKILTSLNVVTKSTRLGDGRVVKMRPLVLYADGNRF